MSASAPLGRPSRKTGNVDADWTSATITGDVVSDVISHADATSFIHMQVLAVAQTPHSILKVGWARGAHGPTRGVGWMTGMTGASLMPMHSCPTPAALSAQVGTRGGQSGPDRGAAAPEDCSDLTAADRR